MKKTRFIVELDGQKMELSAGFVGGFMADMSNAPMGMYAGNLSLEDTSISLLHILRAVIKINVEEQGLNHEQSKVFINFAVEQAIKIEKENADEENVSIEKHNEIVLKMRKDNPKNKYN